MNFRLEFTPTRAENKITHRDKIFLIGSCFSENLGNKLLSHKFDVLQNPYGVLFNPVSIADAIDRFAENKKITSRELFYHNESFHHWSLHGLLSNPNLDEAVTNINHITEASFNFIKKVDVVIITLGSAFGYALTEQAPLYTQNFIVANNHKGPASWFDRQLLSPQRIKTDLQKVIARLQSLNKDVKIIFTVSPVRHLREGFIENNRSKAILLSIVHELVEEAQSVSYFPAYELVIDDLRDYRFYAEDMVHPNYTATNYVWQKLQDVYFDAATRKLLKQIEELNLAVAHKPFNPNSAAHKKFKQVQLAKSQQLQQTNSHLNFNKEIKFFSAD